MVYYMRHYEIVFMVYPNKSIYINDIIKHYSFIVNSNNGKIHRLEDWGLRYLAYSIKKYYKAHYVLMNIEVDINVMNKLKIDFQLNLNILRFMFLKIKKSVINSSFMNVSSK